METLTTPTGAQHSAAAQRNGPLILQALRQVLPASGLALEIASGTGQHIALFASELPQWTWQPSDYVPNNFGSIQAWCEHYRATNVKAPIQINVKHTVWPVEMIQAGLQFDVIYCANMLHIADWDCCAGLMHGAARYLKSTGLLITYGPYLERDVTTSLGNLEFDKQLKASNPAWGIRHLDEVVSMAERCSLRLVQRCQMPANNLMLVFGKE
ncbi:MAG: DUF938 domain-containing protein [Rhodoferax sp.]|nr:DUF938 domain-containing protein [Rhodoferax sp.]